METESSRSAATVTTTGGAPYRSALLTRLAIIWRRWNGSTTATGSPARRTSTSAAALQTRPARPRRPRPAAPRSGGSRSSPTRSWPSRGCPRAGPRAAGRRPAPSRPGRALDSSSELLPGLLQHLEVAQHQRQGLAGVVADHAQHVRVELVDLVQLVVDAPQVAGQPVGGGDVLEHAGQSRDGPVRVPLGADAAEHLADLAVGTDDAVLELVALTALPGVPHLRDHTVAVLRVHLREQGLRLRGERVGVAAHDPRHLRRPRDLPRGVDHLPAAELGDLLGLVELTLGLHP